MTARRSVWGALFAGLMVWPLAPAASFLAATEKAETSRRPRVVGLSHVAFRVSDPARARSFFEDLLGFTAVSVTAADGSTRLLVGINDRQYVELRPGLRADEDRLDHVALQTADVEAMRRYLAGRGIEVPKSTVRDASGNEAFLVRDPEGRAVELVQHRREGFPARGMPASPRALSRHMMHAGVLVGDLVAANRFYGDVLGLTEIWRGSRSGTELSWTNMRVPDGDDYLEFMLYGEVPAADARGTQHHVCLEVADIEEARVRLLERREKASYTRPIETRVGTNRKRQLNLFDPDGTRVELMEARTVDGQPVPSSTAPPPRPR